MPYHVSLKVAFDTNKYLEKLDGRKQYFQTFLDKENIAAGILRLEPGQKDMQEPHDSDEVYYVVRGDGFLDIAGRDYPVSQGMSYFVAKKIPHKFHGNDKELVVVYFFSGPDS